VSEESRDGEKGPATAKVEAENPRDLGRFVQHRQLDVYEQGMARLTYAYGVDIRRSRWLVSSNLGNTLVRAVDRGWPELSTVLMKSELEGPEGIPPALLARVSAVLGFLRAPRPSLRALKRSPRQADLRWPIVTPLGATHGGANWLILDTDALGRLEPSTVDFVLGAGLGHLQCDHAVFFTAHLLAARRTAGFSVRLIQQILTPWSRVMAFSADRAGLLAVGSLEGAIAGLRANMDAGDPTFGGRDWLPHPPAFEHRKQALEEFARSEVFARARALREADSKGATLLGNVRASAPSPTGIPDDAWSLARVDRRLTRRLRLF
jgi:hypothetical protein